MQSFMLCLVLLVAAAAGENLHRGLFHHKQAAAAAKVAAAPAFLSKAVVASDSEDRDEDEHDKSDEDVAVDAEPSTTPAAPSDAPEDDFPSLPAVSSMTGASSETLKSLNSQAGILEARVAQAQMEHEARLNREKTVFEQRLRAQERGNRAVVAQNAEIQKQNDELSKENSKLKKHAEAVKDGNRLKRTELQTLQAKLGTAGDFVVDKLKDSTDQNAKELAVLTMPAIGAAHIDEKANSEHATKMSIEEATAEEKQAKTEEKKEKVEDKAEDKDDDKADDKDDDKADDKDDKADDKDDDKDNSTDAESFIAVARRIHRAVGKGQAVDLDEMADVEAALAEKNAPSSSNPRDILTVLKEGVDNLAKQEKASDAHMKAMFVTAFKDGTKRHATLLANQKSLNATHAALKTRESKLQSAVTHLEGRRVSLKDNLKSLGLYLKSLSNLALAPSAEVHHVMQSIPTDVAHAFHANGEAAATANTAAVSTEADEDEATQASEAGF